MYRKWYFMVVLLLLCVMAVYGCKGTDGRKGRECVKVATRSVGVCEDDMVRWYSGTVEEESGSSLSFSGMGTVRRLYVDEGEMVEAGRLLAEVDATTAGNAYEAALAARKEAEDVYERMRLLHEAGSLPEMKWIEVGSRLQEAVSSERIARKGLGDCRLYAPYGGYIARKSVEVGQNVAAGVEVVKLVRIERVKVKVSVPEEEIGGIVMGESAVVRVAALGGRTFVGKVVERGVVANALSRTYDVKVLLGNVGHELLPGMVCDVGVKGKEGECGVCLLPAELVQIDVDNRPFVWTVVDGRAHRVYVSLGGNVGNDVVISGGLSGKECVIVRGQQKVSEGTRVVVDEGGGERCVKK